MPSRHHYRLFGLSVESQVPLPDLAPSEAVEAPDVKILVGGFPRGPGEREDRFSHSDQGSILNIPSAGRYLIRNGREILVDPAPSASDRNMRLFLLGSAFGILLHQRNILPLHANALVISGQAVAFLGVSGAGKSTMAAWFHDRGHPILTDDVCAVTFDHGQPLAQPGIPRLRLWRDALEATGRTSDDYERSFDEDDKYNVPTRSDAWSKAMPIGAIYHLDTPDPERTLSSIERVSGMAAAEILIANTYRGFYLPELGGVAEHFRSCTRLASEVPIFAVKRRWGIEVYEEQLSAIEAHVRTVITGKSPS